MHSHQFICSSASYIRRFQWRTGHPTTSTSTGPGTKSKWPSQYCTRAAACRRVSGTGKKHLKALQKTAVIDEDGESTTDSGVESDERLDLDEEEESDFDDAIDGDEDMEDENM